MMNDLNTKRLLLFELAHLKSLSLSEKIMAAGELAVHPFSDMRQLLFYLPFKRTTREKALQEKEAFSTTSLLKEYQNKNTGWFTIFDDCYPAALRQIFEPPILLFYKGDLSLLSDDKLGVVGSRKGGPYGESVVDSFLTELAPRFAIVSGLAKGIDAFAHKKAIELQGRTIAITGCGLDRCYPYENRLLQKEIASEHLILSEYPLGARPLRHHFPLRNRLIAGISLGILVVEAEYKSGSLITAQLALNEGREVFCIPGSVLSPLSLGPNHLIQQGAHCAFEPSLILDVLAFV